ncbi:MAG TPA: sugar transferase [Chloroflexota bacterium]|nr:sugar transferase [Chloroflexota bacterium]
MRAEGTPHLSSTPESALFGHARRELATVGRVSYLLPKTLIALTDVVLINIAFFLAWFARYRLELGAEVAVENYVDWETYSTIQLALTAILLIVFRLQGLYRLRRGAGFVDEMGLVVNGTLIGIAVMIVGVFYLRPFGLSRLVFVYAGIAIVLLLGLGRVVRRAYQGVMRRRGIGLERIVVVGTGPLGRMIMQNVVAQPELGYRIVGFVDDERTEDIGRFHALGRPEDIPRLVDELDVDEVIIALPSSDHARTSQLLMSCAEKHVGFRIVPDFYELSLNQVDIVDINGIPLIGLREAQLSGTNLLVKRAIDVVLASITVVAISWLLLLIGLAIKLDSPGPVLHRSIRVGRGGKPFDFLKFRSMRQDADALLDRVLHLDDAHSGGRLFKSRNDPRRTRLGRWLRRTSLDELPQLWNVLRGEMSIVGPRPPFPHEVEKYDDWHRRRLEVTPGLTGLSQVSGRSDLTFDETALLDIWYIENWSIGLDLKIMLRSVPVVALGTGAY